MTPPTVVSDLSKQANGKPLDWKEYDDRWVIVFEDGRKLSFDKADISEPKPTPKAKSAKIDLSDGVDEEEASTAGKALAERKKGK